VPVDANTLALERPRSLNEALTMLAGEPRLVPLAGCTDVYVGLHFGTMADQRFIDLWPLKELRGISVERDVLHIGALTTYTEIIRSKIVQKRLPMLVAAAREVGGAQIQNRGTLGGNVANASPAGDTLPVLAAMGAVVVLRSATGERRVNFNEFYTGYRSSVRRTDELIVAIEIPALAGKQGFRKVGTRAAQAISKIVIAAVRAPVPKIGFGSVAATVVRVPKTEEALAAGRSIDDAIEVLQKEIKPIDDIRSTAEYRLKVASNLVRQFWQETA